MAIGSVDDRTFETEKKEDDWTANLSNQPHHFFGFAGKKEHATKFFLTSVLLLKALLKFHLVITGSGLFPTRQTKPQAEKGTKV